MLDERGVPKAFAAQDGTSLRRYEIASGKAHGALSFGIGSRALAKRAAASPQFIAAVTHAVGGSLIPVPGGVLIRNADKAIVGAVGISGDNSDNDEAAAIAGITAAGLVADPGEGQPTAGILRSVAATATTHIPSAAATTSARARP